ncbi:hypothetical protein CRV08_13940 [Halarcobacter ebronensis]|uniref:Small multi-drug export protein n=1 Tax=Halarcobacter ebronensis TaxID=1462615 RepID=A0A4Q0YA75_9BACT|nr:small multi-drug export protein [Halarcobacter ebronensis]RXJ65929.1 hypothetical protein CRV08_13940 [Halarcobacter ebronensis]
MNLFNKELQKRLFSTQEGLILILSFSLIFFTTFSLVFFYFYDAVFASKITTMIFTNIFIGRVPAISFGYASNLSHIVVIVFNIIAEMILVTLIYSIFVFSFKGVVRVKGLEDFFNKVKEKKEKHKNIFLKYGRLGLFIFVFIPFWMTGPIVGSIIGFLIGMKHFTIIFIVFLATIISMTLWGLFLQEIVAFLGEFDIRFIWILILIAVVSVIIFKLKRRK